MYINNMSTLKPFCVPQGRLVIGEKLIIIHFLSQALINLKLKSTFCKPFIMHSRILQYNLRPNIVVSNIMC